MTGNAATQAICRPGIAARIASDRPESSRDGAVDGGAIGRRGPTGFRPGSGRRHQRPSAAAWNGQ